MKRLFWGGIHPSGHKELADPARITTLPAPAQAVIPLSQHIGAPAQPLVAVGDQVTMGQKIGDGQGLCVSVHAPVSGRVTAIEARPCPGGVRTAVVIENDFQDTFASALTPYTTADPEGEALLTILREAGIVGMGGAAFPTGVKAAVPAGQVDTLIVNACECEPYITADDALLRAWPQRVVDGVKLLRRAVGPQRAVIALEDNKPAAAKALEPLLAGEDGITLQLLPTRYPQGAEKQLIFAVTGRQVPPGKLPKDVGCAVFNAGTCAAVSRAVREGMPLLDRIVTVTGPAVAQPQNFLVRVGTPFTQVLAAAGGLREDAWKVIAGGPMMGVAQSDLAVPVVKATNAILCLSQRENGEISNPVCFRCGKCVEACPMHLQPLYFHRYSATGSVAQLQRYHIFDCIECGCCAYVCPGKLPLVASIRRGKQQVKEGSAQ